MLDYLKDKQKTQNSEIFVNSNIGSLQCCKQSSKFFPRFFQSI